jgi:hypothetical protein
MGSRYGLGRILLHIARRPWAAAPKIQPVSGRTRLRGHTRSLLAGCTKLLRRSGQLTTGRRPRRSNLSVWSGFRPDMSERAWQRPSRARWAFIQSGCWQTVPRGKTETAPTGGGLRPLYPSDIPWGDGASGRPHQVARDAFVPSRPECPARPSHSEPGRMVIASGSASRTASFTVLRSRRCSGGNYITAS